VLDRWHLCKNLEEVLQKALARQIDVLRQAGQEIKGEKQDQPTAPEKLAQTRGRQRKPESAESAVSQPAARPGLSRSINRFMNWQLREYPTEKSRPVCRSSVKPCVNI
jgi:hypothetical protein